MTNQELEELVVAQATRITELERRLSDVESGRMVGGGNITVNLRQEFANADPDRVARAFTDALEKIKRQRAGFSTSDREALKQDTRDAVDAAKEDDSEPHSLEGSIEISGALECEHCLFSDGAHDPACFVVAQRAKQQ